MIISGGSRSNGGFFASHLMRSDHNERVDVREISGLLATNVREAFREMETIASGTQCKNYFYHADINTRQDEHLTLGQWREAADALERELGLEGQPRFIVEHEKEGRTHQHIIWSRIDRNSMTTISDSHDYAKHERVATALEQAFGHQATQRALTREKGTERPEQCPRDWATFRAQESGIDPKAIKAELTELWQRADTGRAFAASMAERGYILARGDRRDFCIIDRAGDDHSLGRQIAGVKAAALRERMADIDRAALPSVAEARVLAREQREETDGGSGGATPILEPAPSRNVDRDDAPPSDFDALMWETRRKAARLHPIAAPEPHQEAPAEANPQPEAARSAFDEAMADTQRRAARLAAAEAAMLDGERRQASHEGWKASLRHHLTNLRGQIAEWWREFFEFDRPDDSPQKDYER